MAKSQLKGTKKVNAIVSKETITIVKNILKAWNLIPSQDIDKIGKLHNDVVQICANINKNYNKDNLFNLLPYLIKIPYHIAEGLHFNLVNKLRSSSNEYKEANKLYNEAMEEFQRIRSTIDKKFISIFPIFEFLECCHSITSILKKDSSNVLKNKKNQVKRFRDLAGWFRKIHSDLVYLDNKNLEEELNNMSTLAKRMTDMYKTNAQEIETDDEQIIFMKPINNKVFIVHGHDTAIMKKLKNFLKKSCDIKPIVLIKVPNKGRTIIEKFEHYARISSFAFVIITKDDLVENKEEHYYQGRPNVFFELGWFCGRYGRDRVGIIKEKGVKIPSDLNGILTFDFHKKLDEISGEIKANLEHSGII